MKKKDWVGLKFDMLTVVEDLGNNTVMCDCECGNSGKILHKRNFSDNHKKSCGCHRRKSEVGNKYNQLTILEDYVGKTKGGYKLCKAKCDCGRIIETRTIYITTNDVKSCGCLKSDTYINLKYDIFKERTPESLYWAGFIAADGCVTDENKLVIRLQVSDLGHLEKFKKWINASVKIAHNKSNNTYGISIGNKIVCKDLLEYGIGQRKSLTYKPPQFCCESVDFWRGMIDGDGHIGKNMRRIGFCGTEDTCEAFGAFVRGFCNSRAVVRKRGSIYVIEYGGRNITRLICEKLYGGNQVFYLDRKHSLAMEIMEKPADCDFQNTYIGYTSEMVECLICGGEYHHKGIPEHYRWCKIKNMLPLADDNIII